MHTSTNTWHGSHEGCGQFKDFSCRTFSEGTTGPSWRLHKSVEYITVPEKVRSGSLYRDHIDLFIEMPVQTQALQGVKVNQTLVVGQLCSYFFGKSRSLDTHVEHRSALQALGLQVPPQKVSGPSRPTLNTFSEGTWSPREGFVVIFLGHRLASLLVILQCYVDLTKEPLRQEVGLSSRTTQGQEVFPAVKAFFSSSSSSITTS